MATPSLGLPHCCACPGLNLFKVRALYSFSYCEPLVMASSPFLSQIPSLSLAQMLHTIALTSVLTHACAARIWPVKDGSVAQNSHRAVHYVLRCRETADPRIKPILAAMVAFFEAQKTIKAGYTLDGKPLETYTHICFQAPVWCLFKARFPAV